MINGQFVVSSYAETMVTELNQHQLPEDEVRA